MYRLKTPFQSAIAWRAAAMIACGFAPFAGSAAAQTVSRPVVQPLPSPSVSALDAALRRLAADPRNVSALIDAGSAALALNDVDAAIGFFSRASELAPQNARAKAGLGSAFVRSENPYDAMLLFEEALRLGASSISLAPDRGLAADLVGDTVGAQSFYREALAAGPNDEVSRRLALNFAVSGNRNSMEDTLLPLLKKGDLAAYRTRAFGLAILGDPKEASDIADAVMPKEMAKRIKPYFRHMPRLTAAQQVAAASFGHFPSAKNIGSDDPRVARYSETAKAQRNVRTADAGLIPAGEPLGPKANPAASKEKPVVAAKVEKQREGRKAEKGEQIALATPATRPAPPAAATRTPVAPSAPPSSVAPSRELPPANAVPSAPLTRSVAPPAASPRAAPPTARPVASPQVAVSSAPAARAPVSPPPAPLPAPPPASTASPVPAQVSFDLRDVPQTRVAQAAPPAPVPTASAPSAPVPSSTPSAAPATAGPNPAVAMGGLPGTPPPSPAPVPPATERKFGSVADAFADFDLSAAPPVAARAGAVDITKINVVREAPPAPKVEKSVEAAKAAQEKQAEKPKKPEPKKPQHPSRIWVQVATGRDKNALAFDWRRMNRQQAELFKGRTPYVTAWGQTNRLLTGPFPTDAAARDYLKKLKAAELDSFAFTSAEGQVVDALPVAR